MTVKMPACMTCVHYRYDAPLSCAAFPHRIPNIVWLRADPHTKPIAGDNGILYEPIKEPGNGPPHDETAR
jgi:hypothetical protein